MIKNHEYISNSFVAFDVFLRWRKVTFCNFYANWLVNHLTLGRPSLRTKKKNCFSENPFGEKSTLSVVVLAKVNIWQLFQKGCGHRAQVRWPSIRSCNELEQAIMRQIWDKPIWNILYEAWYQVIWTLIEDGRANKIRKLLFENWNSCSREKISRGTWRSNSRKHPVIEHKKMCFNCY